MLTDRERAALRPSRSQRKRDLEKLHVLSEQLMALTPGQFARMQLPEHLLEALVEGRRLTDRNARRRQILFITGILQECDVLPLHAGLRTVNHR